MAQLGSADEEKRAVQSLVGSDGTTLVRVGNATNGAVYTIALANNECVRARDASMEWNGNGACCLCL